MIHSYSTTTSRANENFTQKSFQTDLKARFIDFVNVTFNKIPTDMVYQLLLLNIFYTSF